MKNRRTHILSVSKTLFNNQGYSNVTIRMIALELKISSGNLNYHFKKREDILESLYFEMVSEFDTRVQNLDKKEINLKSIKEDIRTSMERMKDYHFFWTDLYNLLRLNDKISTHFENVYQDRTKGYQFLFSYLIKNDTLQSFESTKERDFLIARMIDFSNTWLYNSCIYKNKIDDTYISKQTESLLFMLYPYFTNSGKKEFKKI